MKKLEIAINLIVNDIKEDLNGYYSDREINAWSEYLEETGRDSSEFKADVYYILMKYSNENNVNVFLNDSYELELENGEIVSYRKIMNMVRKQLKAEGYFA